MVVEFQSERAVGEITDSPRLRRTVGQVQQHTPKRPIGTTKIGEPLGRPHVGLVLDGLTQPGREEVAAECVGKTDSGCFVGPGALVREGHQPMRGSGQSGDRPAVRRVWCFRSRPR